MRRASRLWVAVSLCFAATFAVADGKQDVQSNQVEAGESAVVSDVPIDNVESGSSSVSAQKQDAGSSDNSDKLSASAPLVKQSQNENTSKNSSLKPSISETSNWPYVLLVLGAMIACILLMAWILRRFSGITGVGGRDLRVVNAIGLGARERVAVIDVKGQQFLVGVTPHNISLLHAFDEAPIQTKNAAGSSDFAEKLQKLLKGSELPSSSGDESKEAPKS